LLGDSDQVDQEGGTEVCSVKLPLGSRLGARPPRLLLPMQGSHESWGAYSSGSGRGGGSCGPCSTSPSSSSRCPCAPGGSLGGCDVNGDSIAEATIAVGAVCSVRASPRLSSPAVRTARRPVGGGPWLHPWDGLPNVPKLPQLPPAGILKSCPAAPGVAVTPGTPVTPICQVCLEPVRKLQLGVDLGCGHLTCDECWRGVLRACLDLGSVRGARCPAEGCGRGLPLPATQMLLKDRVGMATGMSGCSIAP
jgi:hypothetical protein